MFLIILCQLINAGDLIKQGSRYMANRRTRLPELNDLVKLSS